MSSHHHTLQEAGPGANPSTPQRPPFMSQEHHWDLFWQDEGPLESYYSLDCATECSHCLYNSSQYLPGSRRYNGWSCAGAHQTVYTVCRSEDADYVHRMLTEHDYIYCTGCDTHTRIQTCEYVWAKQKSLLITYIYLRYIPLISFELFPHSQTVGFITGLLEL